MIFIAGSLDRQAPARALARVAAMAAERRTALAAETSVQACGPLQVSCAGCRVHRATAGEVEVLVFRPRIEAWQPDSSVLGRLADGWRAGRTLALQDFEGPFLAVLWDGRDGRLVLASDRFGACPLYVDAGAGRIEFATDLVALAESEDAARYDVDPQAIYDYVFFHCIPAPRTIYRGIRKLGPAEQLTWDGERLDATPWWRPTFSSAAADAPPPAALLEALEGAVAERVTPGCGAFLSGGLDSSSVAGMLARSTAEARTFTIGFDAEGYDESGFARIAADHFATRHHEYFVVPADVTDILPRIAAHYGEPFGNSSVVPAYYCARLARGHGVDLMLAGDGGDELFAGNTRYTAQNVFETWFRVPGLLRAAIEAGYRIAPVLERLPVARKGASYIRQARMGLPDRLQSYNFLNRFEPATVFDGTWLGQVDTANPWRLWRARYAEPAAASALQRMLYLDWKFTLADNDLVKVNNMCDLAGVEVTYPMLDRRVVDFSCRLSTETLLPGGELRGYYKRAVGEFLPRAIIDKSKHGFGLPFGVWMRNDDGLARLTADALAGLRQRQIFATDFLDEAERLFRHDAAGYYGELLWILSMLELWLDAHKR